MKVAGSAKVGSRPPYIIPLAAWELGTRVSCLAPSPDLCWTLAASRIVTLVGSYFFHSLSFALH